MQDWTPREHYTAEDLVEIIRILRDGENGCPWDKVQTHASIRKNFLEETCEALEAIDADDPVMMQEELGDVLMQVVFHTVIEEERGRFDMEKVCREVCEKLVFRHPNIFASSAAENAGINSWDALKNKEKGRTTLADELDTVPATLPALMRAQKLQKRAARFGCGPEDAAGAARALDSAKAAWDAQQTAENAGELLLAAADTGAKQVCLAGGVAANGRLRQLVNDGAQKLGAKVYLPELKFCGDNGAMIAAQGYYQYMAGHTAGLDLNGLPTLPIDYE